MKWETDSFLGSFYEDEVISKDIKVSGSNSFEIEVTSGEFPSSLTLSNDYGTITIEGKAPLVKETKMFSFLLTAHDTSSEHQVPIGRTFAIEVKNKQTTWDDSNPTSFETLEKTYFNYQFKLNNPNGDEKFIKIAGGLPNGLSLSESGLLYGVPEEDKDSEYTFIIGVYRNNEKLFDSGELTIKIDDLSTSTKPLWITDSGILDYIYYEQYKKLSFLAYDYNGRKVYYEQTDEHENNLPDGIIFDETTKNTGVLSGVCKTKEVNKWRFKVTPYIFENDQRINGDTRIFYLVTNYIEEDDMITWETDSLEPVKIGYRYNFNIVAKSNHKLTYNIVEGKLPSGLTMNRNGEIYGIIEKQDIGTYSFTVRASSDITFEQKTFSIDVLEGLPQNTIDTFLYINYENQPEFQNLILNFDRTSAYNVLNTNYQISMHPKIDVATINTFDPVLLKYKFNQFNTPIEIFWKETKKKSFENYDFFYKDFMEGNKISETFGLPIPEERKNYTNSVNADIKLHDVVYDNDNNMIGYVKYVDKNDYFIAYDFNNEKWGRVDKLTNDVYNLYNDEKIGYVKNDETKYIRDDGTTEKRGYIRTPINTSDINIEYYELGPNKDPSSIEDLGKRIYDIENIYEEVNDERTNYYYINPDDKEEEWLIHDPIYNPQRDIYDYVKYGKIYIGDEENKTYITPIHKGMYYEVESKKIIPTGTDIFVKIETKNTGEDDVIKYIIVNNEEIRVEPIVEDGYASYDPSSEKGDQYLLNKLDYEIINYEKNEDNYYELTSPKLKFTNASIDGLRKIFTESFNVDVFDDSDKLDRYNYNQYEDKREEYNGKLWYKIGNQEIIYRKDGSVQKFDYHRYTLKYNEKKDYYYVDFNGEIYYLFVWRQMDDNSYKKVYANIGTDENPIFKPLVQKTNILDGEVDFIFYCVYEKDKKFPFVNGLFTCEWDPSIHLTCEYNEESGMYEWYRVAEAYKPYVYYAKNNIEYGYDKDIVLPYIDEENIVDGKVTFLNLEEEKNLLPEYMEKEYTPTLPLFYGIPNSHNSVIKSINAKEKEGQYWSGRKFIFYELHFSPKYGIKNYILDSEENSQTDKKYIDNFTIDFYNDINNNSPEFLLI